METKNFSPKRLEKKFLVVEKGTEVHIDNWRKGDQGVFNSALSNESRALNMYAAYSDKRHVDLEIGERCKVKLALGESRGEYEIVRVE